MLSVFLEKIFLASDVDIYLLPASLIAFALGVAGVAIIILYGKGKSR